MGTKQVVVATEAIDFCQAIYVDGRMVWEGDTAQALDIVTAVCQGKSATTAPIKLRCVNVDLPIAADGFPATLDELRPLVSPVDEPLEPITPHPFRIQRRRTKGFRLPHGATSVTRPGRWGNPFATAEQFDRVLRQILDPPHTVTDSITTEQFTRMNEIALNIGQLRGFRLACFCSLDEPCHADSLAREANR